MILSFFSLFLFVKYAWVVKISLKFVRCFTVINLFFVLKKQLTTKCFNFSYRLFYYFYLLCLRQVNLSLKLKLFYFLSIMLFLLFLSFRFMQFCKNNQCVYKNNIILYSELYASHKNDDSWFLFLFHSITKTIFTTL